MNGDVPPLPCSKSSTQCVICLDTLEPAQMCLFFSPSRCDCIVVTHLECGTHWLDTEQSCIICKKPLQIKDYLPGAYSQATDIFSQLAIRQQKIKKRQDYWNNCREQTTVIRKFIFYVFIMGSVIAFIYLVSIGIQNELPGWINHSWAPPIPDTLNLSNKFSI